MTHITTVEKRPRAEWESWFVEAGIDYVEVLRCPEPACEVCTDHGRISAAA